MHVMMESLSIEGVVVARFGSKDTDGLASSTQTRSVVDEVTSEVLLTHKTGLKSFSHS